MNENIVLSELDMVDKLFLLESGKHPGRDYRGKAAVMYRFQSGIQAAIGEPDYIQEIINRSGKGIFYSIPTDDDSLLKQEIRAAFREVDVQ